MKLTEHKSLIPFAVAIQPHLAWMLATVPDMIRDGNKAAKVLDVLEDLNLKFARLNGQILEQDSKVFTVDEEDILLVGEGKLTQVKSDGGPIVVIATDSDVESLKSTEEVLREALAEIIVTRGEAELEAEALAKRDAELDAELAAELAEEANVSPLQTSVFPLDDDIPDIDLDGHPLDEEIAFPPST